MAGPHGLVRDLPACCVQQTQVSKEPRQIAVFARMSDEVPVIAHQAPAQQRQRMPLLRREQRTLESREVRLLLEQPQAAIGARLMT